jgi:predicted P-loop ATPase
MNGRWWVMVREAKVDLDRELDAPDGLMCGANGQPKPSLANAITLLQSTLTLAYDSFSAVTINQKPSPWGTSGRWSDLDDVSAANYLQHANVGISSALAHEAAYYLAKQNPIHPVRDWLNSLKWDGTPRLDRLADYYWGCPDSEYARMVSVFWPLSAVARIMRPGCIAKYMVVLEGEQDEGKSKSLRALVNGHLDGDKGVQWFRDNMPDIDHKDIGMYMQGVWIIEIAELSAVRGKEWERTKAFISSPRDTFRAPYGRNMEDYPRQCVFAGSTNEDKWGGDQTGLTRFWPLRPGKLRIDDILRDREQLWAEAKALFDEGRQWYGDAAFDQLAHAEQDERYDEDIMMVPALEKADLLAIDGWFMTYHVIEKLGLPAQQSGIKRRVDAIQRRAGYVKHQASKGPNRGKQGWLKIGADSE